MDLVGSFIGQVDSRHTRRAYKTDLRLFFQESNVRKSHVTSIEPDAVQSFVRAMHRSGKSLSTQQRRLAALRSFYDWLIDEGVVAHNPARNPQVHPLRSESGSGRDVLGKSDVEDILQAAGESPNSGARDQALILTIVYGALRRAEVASLDVEDVRPLGRYWILDLEEDSPDRAYVRIPEAVVEAIDRVQARHNIDEGALWRSVSPQNAGERMTPDAIYKVVRRVSERAGYASVSIDRLRRAGLQLALAGGATLPQVQAHGRFRDSASAARLHDEGERSGTLGDSAVEHIDIDLPKALTKADSS